MSLCTKSDINEIDEMIQTLFQESSEEVLGHAEQQQAKSKLNGKPSEPGRLKGAKCYSNCVTVGEPCGLNPFNRSTLPEWAIGLPPMSTTPSYQGPVIRGPCGIPTPLLRLKQLDCYLPRTVQVLADSFGFFPANSVCFNDDLTRKVACAMSAYSRIPNSKLNQYICDFQNQWIFFLGALLALTPAPLKCKMFDAARSTMRATANPQSALCRMFGWGCCGNQNVCNTGNCYPQCPAGWSCVQTACDDPCGCDCGLDHCQKQNNCNDCDDGFNVPSLCGSWSFNIGDCNC